MEQALVREVVILGGGSAGWMTAAALSKLLQEQVRVTVVESDEIGTVGVGEATIPMIQQFNALLEIDETEFIRATQGTFKLGIEFDGWGGPGHRYMHGFGRFRQDFRLATFEQFWQKLAAHGRAGDLGDYLVSRQAAAANRFARPRPEQPDSPMSDLAYAYHFDASLYARFLRAFAEKRGARRVEGRVEHVRRDARGALAALVLADGRSVEGGFFVDCSGFRGRLIEEELHAGYEDWTHWLPCDRATAVPCESVRPLTPFTRSTLRPAGWQWRIPLQHRIGNGYVWSSRHTSEDEAAATLLAHLDGAPLAEPRTLRFVTGMRKRPWIGNCVAIGLSSGFVEPLESTSLHLIQTAIGRLLTWFPGVVPSEPDIDEANRQARREFEHVRDFIVLHYHANGADAPLWRACREMAIPESLRRRIALFEASGRVACEAHELFAAPNWLQVLHGQGLRPSGRHALVDVVPEEDAATYLENVRRTIAHCVQAMPTHEEFIRQHCKA